MNIQKLFKLNKINPFNENNEINLKNSFIDIDNLFLNRKNIFNSDVEFKIFSNNENNKIKLLWNENDYKDFFIKGKSFKNNVLNMYLNQLNLNIENNYFPIFIFQSGNENRIYFYKNEIIVFLNNEINNNTIKNMILEIFEIFNLMRQKF